MVSILMPAYNAAKFIKDAIESVLTQSFGDWELIIVDDKSTDDTYFIARDYAEKDSRIFLFQLEHNSGCPHVARTEAFHHSKGDIVVRLDADDFWERDYLKKLLDRQKESLADFVCDRGANVQENGTLFPNDIPEVYDYTTVFTGKDICRKTIGGWYVSARGIVKREKWSKALELFDGESKSISSDEIFVRQVLICCDRVAFAPALCYYRLHGGSITKRFSMSRFSYLENENEVVNFVVKYYGKEDSAYVSAVTHYYFSILSAAHLYVDNRKMLSSAERGNVRRMLFINWYRLDSVVLRNVSLKIWLNYCFGPILFLCRVELKQFMSS